jgi:hypothetical protein
MVLDSSRLRFFLTTLAGALAISGSAHAAVPGTLTQQGRLLDSSGTPITNSVSITFTLYDAATAGTSLWTETTTVTPDSGYFSVQLGSTTAFGATAFDGSTRYLGVKVGSDPEMTPRETVSSVPYAMHVGWTGITDFPAPCTAPQFLSGYDASGNPVCTSPQALSCSTVFAAVSGATFAAASCPTGTTLTGGGCWSNGTLSASYPYRCTSTLCACLIGGPCYGPNDYLCDTTASANIDAFARCCSLQ